MRGTLLLTLSTSLLFISTATYAQDKSQEDDRFKPRVYGNLGVTGAVYSEGAKQHLSLDPANTQGTEIIRVEEPVPSGEAATITYSAPVKIEAGVVKAQHIKHGDVSEEDYQRLLDEAERVRAFKGVTATQQTTIEKPEVETLYEIQLFEEPAPATSQQTAALISHNVIKGDTLYNISKRYGVTIEAIQSANDIEGSSISLGQVLTIPERSRITMKTPMTMNTITEQPVLVSTDTVIEEPATIKRVVLPVEVSTNSVYAVLPKDTLYSISRRTCTSVSDLISQNGIENPNALKPGQRLVLPTGHCLTQ